MKKRVPKSTTTKTSLMEFDVSKANRMECDLIKEFCLKKIEEVKSSPSSAENLSAFMNYQSKLREVSKRKTELNK